MSHPKGPLAALGSLVLALGTVVLVPSARAQAPPLGDTIVLSWNDLGMHCMNRNHSVLSVLPPYNTLLAQVIRRGDATRLPEILTQGISLEYSIPGNTTSVTKTDFWTWADDLFGVNLPPDVGLTGLGLTGSFTVHGTHFAAEGIPVTPFTDANPTVEDPYQQALVILRDDLGSERFRSRPVIPVSTEMSCVSSGCHASEQAILNGHEREDGFDPNATPVLCADCHGSPPLTGLDPGTAGYFSFRMHDKHNFLDETLPGMAGCLKCHPGTETQCLRGTMANDHGMICQDCHGTVRQVARSIEQGRTPWVEEPACRTCHTAQFGEPVGQLYRQATGHGGVLCAACHNSPHAIWPSREARDNENAVVLQGHAGTLSTCTVCHGTVPDGPGPHGLPVTAAVEEEILAVPGTLLVAPNPLRPGSSAVITGGTAAAGEGRMLIFDARGRTVRLLRAESDGAGAVRARWDGTDASGRAQPAGIYFVRWEGGGTRAAGKVVLTD